MSIKLDSRTHNEIAKEYGVSRTYVCQIKNGTRMKTAFGALDLVLGVEPETALSRLL